MGWASIMSGMPLIGGLFDSAAQEERNKEIIGAEQATTDKTNAANQMIAQKQMDFQREMSNTAWQRGTADMAKAGVNPILAATAGAASTPTGAGIAAQKANVAGAYSAGASQTSAAAASRQSRNSSKQNIINSALGVAKLALVA